MGTDWNNVMGLYFNQNNKKEVENKKQTNPFDDFYSNNNKVEDNPVELSIDPNTKKFIEMNTINKDSVESPKTIETKVREVVVKKAETPIEEKQEETLESISKDINDIIDDYKAKKEVNVITIKEMQEEADEDVAEKMSAIIEDYKEETAVEKPKKEKVAKKHEEIRLSSNDKQSKKDSSKTSAKSHNKAKSSR